MLLLFIGVGAKAANIPSDFADSFGKLYVYHNDRIVPLQTLARDYTAILCGDVSYGDLSAEQLLCEMFFYFDDWQDAPIIKVKGKDIRTIMGIEGAYASINDFMDGDGYKLSAALRGADAKTRRNAEMATEKYNLVMLCSSGMLLNIVPVVSENAETVEWHSVADRSNVIIDSTIEQIADALYAEDYDKAISLVEEIKSEQQKVAQKVLPNNLKFNAELLYNKVHCGKPIAMICIVIGLVTYMLTMRRNTTRWLFVPMCLLFAYISLNIVIRALVSGHIPLSNGFETMSFMAWCCSLLAIIFSKRFRYALPFGFLLCGFSLLVAMMGESTPQITQLMPVLHSPLLSIHVMLIMVAYTLLAFTMMNGVTAIVLHSTNRGATEQIEYLSLISRILLYPAVFLLTVGIFIGAVWANVSWGRYWGWDPKEVWALITMLIYALAIHVQSLKWFRKPIHFHLFCVVAFLSVLMTYFGVNFVLGGLHSYA
jgi:cytochrome c-type biogenesis protein CcsB